MLVTVDRMEGPRGAVERRDAQPPVGEGRCERGTLGPIGEQLLDPQVWRR